MLLPLHMLMLLMIAPESAVTVSGSLEAGLTSRGRLDIGSQTNGVYELESGRTVRGRIERQQ